MHEKNVRNGHISTLHIWPARRPLAACRAALVATLLPDPASKEERERLLERLAGRLVKRLKRKKLATGRIDETEVEETEGGILHWGRESSPDIVYFREEIRKAHGGRAPRVLDPFAGGGAIPLEAIRLGCEVTAVDINPVAWCVLKCTLEYPHRLADQRRPLPDFALESPEFMETFFKSTSNAVRKKQRTGKGKTVQENLLRPGDVDLAWHVRAWGYWVLQRARADLERFYPVIDGKPTVAYLWARTVTCKGCRATIPLLKTLWLCKKDNRRVLLAVRPRADRRGVEFAIESNVAPVGGNNAQRREHDRKIGAGTMSRSGAKCPCCPVIMTMEDIRVEGKAGRLSAVMTVAVVDGPRDKEYRLPAHEEVEAAAAAEHEVSRVFSDLPFGLPDEPLPGKEALGFRVPLYGFDRWSKLFTPRQLVALGILVKHTRGARDAMKDHEYPQSWIEAISSFLAIGVDRTANYLSTLCIWDSGASEIKQTFLRFALPITWDFAEANPLSSADRYYVGAISSIGAVLDKQLATMSADTLPPSVQCGSALSQLGTTYDVVLTDPPYYDAIPYSDLMDFFYVWLRRTLAGLSPEIDAVFREQLGPKWDHGTGDGELIDDASRFDGDAVRSKRSYEEGMARAFQVCHQALEPEGRLVIVFAHKQPDAWETLVSAIIRAGFVVDGSWPIVTEMRGGVRNFRRASLASSVWLVCRKRSNDERSGWDNRVLEEMRANIHGRLREFWDAGIRGPDFVWAATGPALEAYSKHPMVKKANAPGEIMAVSEFLREVRRLVVEFAVGRMLAQDGEEQDSDLDDVSVYYLLHRSDFSFDAAPAGACILYAQACSLLVAALVDQDVLVPAGGQREEEGDGSGEGEEVAEEFEEQGSIRGEGTTSAFRLLPFSGRRSKTLGFEVENHAPPLIDQLHRLMHLWRAGDVNRVNEYLDDRGLRRRPRFHQFVQAVLEMARRQDEAQECALLENISNHLAARGVAPTPEARLPHIDVARTGEEG